MSPSILPDRVTPPPQFAPDESNQTITIVPRATFLPASKIKDTNDQAEAHNAHMALIRNYIPQSVGALKDDHKTIIAKLNELIAGIAGIHARLDRLESEE